MTFKVEPAFDSGQFNVYGATDTLFIPSFITTAGLGSTSGDRLSVNITAGAETSVTKTAGLGSTSGDRLSVNVTVGTETSVTKTVGLGSTSGDRLSASLDFGKVQETSLGSTSGDRLSAVLRAGRVQEASLGVTSGDRLSVNVTVGTESSVTKTAGLGSTLGDRLSVNVTVETETSVITTAGLGSTSGNRLSVNVTVGSQDAITKTVGLGTAVSDRLPTDMTLGNAQEINFGTTVGDRLLSTSTFGNVRELNLGVAAGDRLLASIVAGLKTETTGIGATAGNRLSTTLHAGNVQEVGLGTTTGDRLLINAEPFTSTAGIGATTGDRLPTSATIQLFPITGFQNLGWETGDLTGWTHISGTNMWEILSSDSGLGPFEGTYRLQLGEGNNDGVLEQVLELSSFANPIIDNNDVFIRWFWQEAQSASGESANFRIDFRDGSDNSISFIETGEHGIPGDVSDTWFANSLDGIIPSGTRKIAIQIIGGSFFGGFGAKNRFSVDAQEVKASEILEDAVFTAKLGTATGSRLSAPLYLTDIIFTESFESDFGNFTEAGPTGWTRQQGETTSNNTGPPGAIDGSTYVYVEGGSTGTGEEAFLTWNIQTTDAFVAQTYFAYSMYGADMGTLEVQQGNDTDGWTTIWSRSGDQGPGWLFGGAFTQNPTVGDTIRFKSTAGTTFLSDVALDQITVGEIVRSTVDATATIGTAVSNRLSAELVAGNTLTAGIASASGARLSSTLTAAQNKETELGATAGDHLPITLSAGANLQTGIGATSGDRLSTNVVAGTAGAILPVAGVSTSSSNRLSTTISRGKNNSSALSETVGDRLSAALTIGKAPQVDTGDTIGSRLSAVLKAGNVQQTSIGDTAGNRFSTALAFGKALETIVSTTSGDRLPITVISGAAGSSPVLIIVQ